VVWIEYITAQVTSVKSSCGNSSDGRVTIQVNAGTGLSGDAAKFTLVLKTAAGVTVDTKTDVSLSDESTYEFTGLAAGTYVVTVTQKSSQCECEVTNIVVDSDENAEILAVSLDEDEVCQGTDVTFTATLDDGDLNTVDKAATDVVWTLDADDCPSVAYMNPFYTVPTSTSGCNVSIDDEGNLETTNTDNDGKAKINLLNIGSFNPNLYKYVLIRYRVISSGSNGTGDLWLFYFDNYFNNTYNTNILEHELINDGNWHIMTIDASNSDNWYQNGNKTGFQFRPSTKKGAKVAIDYFALTNFPATDTSDTYVLSTDNLTTGQHVVYATRLGGCQEIACEQNTITVHPAFQKGSIQGSKRICAGQVDQIDQIGSEDISGGVPPYSYEWYLSGENDPISGANSATFTPSDYANTPGTHIFTRKVKDSFCQTDFEPSEGTYTLTVNEVPTVTITPSPVSCNHDNDGVTDDGAIKVEVSGGTGTYSYSISSGAEYNTTTQSFENLTTGEYTVTVTDVNSDPNCSVTSTNILVGEPSKLEVLHLVKNDQDCSHDGSIEFNVQGSHFPYKITWSSPTTTPVVKEDVPEHKESKYIIPNLISQTYTVIVEDGANCSVTKTGLAIQPREQWNPTVPPLLSTTVCNDTPFDFTDELNLGSGTEPISYRWTVSAPIDLTGYDSPGAGTYLSGTLHNGHASEAMTATYTVQALKGLYCYSSPFTATVAVQPGEGSAVDYTLSPVNTCPGPDVTFDIPVVFNSLPSTPVTATWIFGTQEQQKVITTTGTITNPTSFSVPEISDGCSGSFTYSVKVTNGQCTSNKTNKVEVNIDPLSIPVTAYRSETVDCKADAKAPHERAQDTEDEGFTAMPTFTTTCGNKEFVTNNSDVDPLVTYTGTDCNGTVTYTYTYTSCNQTTAIWKYVYTVKDNDGPEMATDATGFPNTATVKSNGHCAFFYPDVATKKDPTTHKSIFYDYLSDNCTDPDEIVITQSPEANTYIEQTDQEQTLKITLYLEDKCGKKTTLTDAITFTVPARLSASINSNNIVDATCNGGDGSLTVTVAGGTPTVTSGTPTYNYVWDKDATKNEATLSAKAGTHSVVVTDANGCSTSTYANITQPSAVRVVVLPAQQTLCEGEPLTLYASASGGSSDNYTYQWYKGTDAISGATTASLDVNESATYKVVAYQGNDQTCPNKNTNNTSVITFNPLPVVAIKSSSTSICPEGSAVLTATKLENVTYEWSDNVDQNNITDDSVATVSPTDNATYTVTVTSSAGCKSQAEATVTVNKPHIELQSLNPQTICAADGNVEIMASTSNFNTAGTNTWQWYTVTVNETTQEETVTPITGQTTTKLQQTGVTATTLYRVVGTNTVGGCPDQESKDVEVLVLDPKVEVPTFSGVTTVCFGGDSTTITATVPNHDEETDGELSFTWDPISGLSTYLGATVKALPAQTTPYQVTAISTLTDDDSDVECSVNKKGTVEVTVNKPELTLNNISVFNVTKNENSNGTICKDESVKLTANTTAVEDNTNYYTWKVGETVVKNASTEAFYVVTPTATTTYTVEVYAVKTVNNVSCTTAVQTREVTITVNDPQVTINNINIYSHIGNTDELLTDNVVCYGTTVKLVADTSGVVGTPTIKWEYWKPSNDPNVVPDPTEEYSHPLWRNNLTDTTKFRLTVTATVGNCPKTDTKDTVVNVLPAFNAGTINAGNASQQVCYGTPEEEITSIAVTQATGGQTPYEYRWYHSYNGNTELTDSTSATFTPVGYSEYPGEHTFTREAKDAECNDWTESTGSYVLEVDEPFDAGSISTNGQTICWGGEVNVINGTEATGGRGDITYQWYHQLNGGPVELIPNATAVTFTPSADVYVKTFGAHHFTRKAFDEYCKTEGEVFDGTYTLQVDDTLSLVLPATVEVCASSSLTNEVVTIKENSQDGNTTSYTYEWNTGIGEGATIISGQNGKEVKAKWPNAGTGHITLKVTNNKGCESHRTVIVTVDTVPVPSLSDTTVCQYSDDFQASVKLTATPAALTYTWDYGVGQLEEEVASNVVKVSWTALGNQTVKVTGEDSKGCSASHTATVTVNTLPIPSVSTTDVQCNGEADGVITVTASNGAEPYQYTLYKIYPLSPDSTNNTGVFSGYGYSTNTIVVTDHNGCQAKEAAIVNQAGGFTVTIDSVYKTSCAGDDGKLEATFHADEAGIYSVKIYGSDNMTVYSDNIILQNPNLNVNIQTSSNLKPEKHTMIVGRIDNNPTSPTYLDILCSRTDTFTVKVNNTLQMAEIPTQVTCSGLGFEVEPTVNMDNTTYSWVAGGVSFSEEESVHGENLVNETGAVQTLVYTVTATNDYCTAERSFNVELRPKVSVEQLSGDEGVLTVCHNTRETTLEATFSGVVSDNTTVTWAFDNVDSEHTNVVTTSNGQDAVDVTLRDKYDTTYTYTVTYSDGVCGASAQGSVKVPAELKLMVDEVKMISCRYKKDGEVKLHATGGTASVGGYDYMLHVGDPLYDSIRTGALVTFNNLYLRPQDRHDSLTDAGDSIHYGYYPITISDNLGCKAQDSVLVWAPDTMVWLYVPDPISLCCNSGETIDITVGPGGIIDPTPKLSQLLTFQSGKTLTYFTGETVGVGSYNYSLQSYDVCKSKGTSLKKSIKVTVYANPSITFHLDNNEENFSVQTVCSGEAIQDIQIDSSYAKIDSVPGLPQGVSYVNGVISGTPDSVTATTTYNYTVYATSEYASDNFAGCGSVTLNGSITVNPAPSVTLVTTPASCTGKDGTITATYQNGVTNHNRAFIALDNGTAVEKGKNDNTQTYDGLSSESHSVTVWLAVYNPETDNYEQGCSATATIDVPLNSPYIGETPYVFSPVTTPNICSGTAFTAEPTAPVFGNYTTTYQWSAPTGNVTDGAASTSAQDNVTGTLGNTTYTVQNAVYTVTPTTGNVCEGPAFTVTVPVNPNVVMNTPDNLTVCSDSSVEVAFTTPITDGTMSYSWSRTNTTGITGLGESGTGNINVSALTNTTITVQTTTFTVTPTYTNNNVSCTGTPVEFTITVNPEVLISVDNNDNLEQTITYGGAITSVELSYSEHAQLTYTTLPDGLTYNPSTNTLSGTPAAAGNHTVTFTATSTQTPNCGKKELTVTIHVTKAQLTVTTNDNSKYYGESDPEPLTTVTLTGLQNGDTQDAILDLLELQFSRAQAGTTAGENVGEYLISATGNLLDNYEVTYQNTGKLTIKGAFLVVKADHKTKTYGEANPTLTATLTGLQGGDEASLITYTLTRTAGENIGEYVITPVGAAVQGNYLVTYDTAKFTITRANATVVADAKSKVYGTSDPTLTATVNGLVNGDAANVITYTLARAQAGQPAGENVGQYAITPSGETVQGNYNVTYEPGTLTITKANVAVTITGNTAVKAYDGSTLTVTGYTALANNSAYDVANVSFVGDSTASGTGNANSTMTYTMPLSAGTFSNTDANYNATFQVTDGWLKVVPEGTVIVNITGDADTVDYDAQVHSVTGYTVEIVDPNNTYTQNDFLFNGQASVSQSNAGVYPMGLASNQFVNTNTNVNVVFHVTDGKLIINKVNAEVTITGNHDSRAYNGASHTISHYVVSNVTPTFYTESDFTFSGTATATRTDAGTTNMGLADNQFTNTNPNFENVTFHVTDGYQTIEPIAVTVTVTGHTYMHEYTAMEQKVTGYDIIASSALFSESDIVFSGDSLASGTPAGTYPMGLAQNQFSCSNPNFQVTFSVTDGWLEIVPAGIVIVNITGHTATKDYNCGDQTLSGYEVVIGGVNENNESYANIYDKSKFTFGGDSVITRNDAGTTSMGLLESQFQNIDNNFLVQFHVTDGWLTINKINAAVTITGRTATETYDGTAHTVTGYQVTSATPTCYSANNILFTGSQADSTASRTDAGITEMNLEPGLFQNTNPNFEVVTFTVVNGKMTVNKDTLNITVNGSSVSRDYTAAEQSYIGAVTATSTSTGFESNKFSYTGNTTASGTTVGDHATALNASYCHYNDDNYIVKWTIGDPVKLTITKAEILLTCPDVNDLTKVYDGSALAPVATAHGVNNSDIIKIEYSTDNGSTWNTTVPSITDAGTQLVKVRASNVNYDTVWCQYTLTVNPKEVTITAKDSTKTYDGLALTQDQFTFSALEAGDTHAFLVAMTNSSTITNVGTQTNEIATVDGTAITATGTAQVIGNYKVTTVAGTLEVTPKEVTLTAKDSTKVFDATAMTQPRFTASALAATDNHVFEVAMTTASTITTVGTQTNEIATVDGTAITTTGTAQVIGNYKVTTVVGTLEVTPKEVTLTAKDSTKVFDATAMTQPRFTASALAATDNHVFAVAMTTASTITNVGTQTNEIATVDGTAITTTGTAQVIGNYKVTTVAGTLEVTPKEVTLTAKDSTKIYDAVALTQPRFTASALSATDNHVFAVAMTTASTITTVGTQTNEIATVDGTAITATGTAQVIGNYKVTTVAGTLNVTPKEVTIKANGVTKVYDNNATTDPTLTATVTGVPANGVAPVYSLSRAAGQNVGEYVISVTAEATSNSNYTVTVDTGLFKITPANLTIKVETDKVYDATKLVTNYNDNGVTLVGNAAGATLTAGVVETNGTAVATYTNAPNATNTVTITTPFAMSDGLSNYTVTYDISMKIKEDVLTLTCPTQQVDTEKVYDGTSISYTAQPSANIATVEYSTDGGNTWNQTPPSLTNAGELQVKVRASAANYATAYCQFTLKVNPMPVTVTITGNNDTKNYNGTEQTVEGYTATATSTMYKDSGSTPDFGLASGQTASASRTAVGTTTMNLAPTMFVNNNTNFDVTFAIAADGYIAITPKAITVKADDASKTYDNNPNNPASYSATVNGLVDNFTPTYTVSRAAGEDAGTYTITPSGAASQGNYTVSYETGTFTINPITTPITITAASEYRTYNGQPLTNSGFTYTEGILVQGDVLSATMEGTVTNVDTVDNTVASWKVMRGNVDVTANYTFATPVKGKLGISKANAMVSADANSKIYGDDDPQLTATVTGTFGNDVLNYQLSRGAGQDFGTYDITVDLGNNPNYNVTTNGNTFTINRAPVTVKANDVYKVFGESGADPALTVTITGLKNGDSESLISYNPLYRQPGDTIGEYIIYVSGTTPQGNYDVTFENGVFRIVAPIKDVTITSGTKSWTYDGAAHTWPSYTVTCEGIAVQPMAEDTTKFVMPTGDTLHIVNPASVTDAGPAVSNTFDTVFFRKTSLYTYNLTNSYGNLSINKKPLTITGTFSKEYDGTPLTVSYSELNYNGGLVDGDVLTAGTITTDGFQAGTYHCGAGNNWSYATMDVGTVTVSGFAPISVTRNYAVNFNLNLTITGRTLAITAGSGEKVYDNLALTNNSFTVTSTLGNGDAVSATVNGFQTCVGESANVIAPASVQVMHDNGNGTFTDVTASYSPVTLTDGLLKVNPITTGFACPGDISVTLPEGVSAITITEAELNGPATLTPAVSGTHVGNNLASTPLGVGTHTVTWTLYDNCNKPMTTCDQTITVKYPECKDSITMASGHKYAIKRIGSQCWFTENLREPVGNYHAYNDNEAANLEKFGYLYSWYTAVGITTEDDVNAVPDDSYVAGDGTHYVQGICPAGWAIPSQADVEVLNLSGFDANMLKDPSTEYWMPGYEGTGESGFKARASGRFNAAMNRYEDLMTGFHFWQSEAPTGTVSVVSACIAYYCGSVLTATPNLKNDRKSVRCLRKVAP